MICLNNNNVRLSKVFEDEYGLTYEVHSDIDTGTVIATEFKNMELTFEWFNSDDKEVSEGGFQLALGIDGDDIQAIKDYLIQRHKDLIKEASKQNEDLKAFKELDEGIVDKVKSVFKKDPKFIYIEGRTGEWEILERCEYKELPNRVFYQVEQENHPNNDKNLKIEFNFVEKVGDKYVELNQDETKKVLQYDKGYNKDLKLVDKLKSQGKLDEEEKDCENCHCKGKDCHRKTITEEIEDDGIDLSKPFTYITYYFDNPYTKKKDEIFNYKVPNEILIKYIKDYLLMKFKVEIKGEVEDILWFITSYCSHYGTSKIFDLFDDVIEQYEDKIKKELEKDAFEQFKKDCDEEETLKEGYDHDPWEEAEAKMDAWNSEYGVSISQDDVEDCFINPTLDIISILFTGEPYETYGGSYYEPAEYDWEELDVDIPVKFMLNNELECGNYIITKDNNKYIITLDVNEEFYDKYKNIGIGSLFILDKTKEKRSEVIDFIAENDYYWEEGLDKIIIDAVENNGGNCIYEKDGKYLVDENKLINYLKTKITYDNKIKFFESRHFI